MPAFALAVAPGGLKVKPAEPDSCVSFPVDPTVPRINGVPIGARRPSLADVRRGEKRVCGQFAERNGPNMVFVAGGLRSANLRSSSPRVSAASGCSTGPASPIGSTGSSSSCSTRTHRGRQPCPAFARALGRPSWPDDLRGARRAARAETRAGAARRATSSSSTKSRDRLRTSAMVRPYGCPAS